MLPARVPAASEAGPARARKVRSSYALTEPHDGLSLALAVSRGPAPPANQHRSTGRYGSRLLQDRCFGVATGPTVMVEHCPRPPPGRQSTYRIRSSPLYGAGQPTVDQVFL